MYTEGEIDILVSFCKETFDLPHEKLSDEYYYQSIPLCIIDAVYSIGIRYEITQKVLRKYCDYYKLKRIRDNERRLPEIQGQHSVDNLLENLDKFNLDFENIADTLFTKNRTSSRNGILKAEAVYHFARKLQKYNINYFQDINKFTVNDLRLENDIKAIKGQTSGISLKYFFMLCGSENLIKPDRMILKFIIERINRNIDAVNATNILRAVCTKLNVE
ncbi:MAG TPA: hypothetical protein ENI12_00920, partial [Nitrospirae bacterium]|nr:hypothetical protein [Nitrospirota bacterium]